MGMGSAYAAGAGMIQKVDSYEPLARAYTDMARASSSMAKGSSSGSGGLSRSSRSGGGSSAANEIQRRRLRMEEREAEQKRQDLWSRKNQYMAAHHGREPTPEELAEMQYGMEAKEKKKERTFRREEKEKEREFAREERGLDRKSGEDSSGLKSREELRRQEAHKRKMSKEDMKIDKMKRTEDHENMMKAWAGGNFKVVEEYFADRNGKGLMVGPNEDPNKIDLKFPEQEDIATMPKKEFTEYLLALGSGYGKRKTGRKKMSEKDIEGSAHKYATQASRDDPDLYPIIYKEKADELRGGTKEKKPKARGKLFKKKALSLLKQIQATTKEKITGARTNPKTGEMELTFEGGRKETVRVE